jgi:hypothetical protein
MDVAVRRHLDGERREVAASLAKWRAESPILRHDLRSVGERAE